ncbi:hypothetical protein Bca52824_075494 [Brassica carinata]|uniref:Uncharacterized protein n=1 Tax=Brassica carinata TaxID=52824 RepID=A0A8X7TVG6_BRACI|nr:hypothetical protein Bca52824_075494 [Brassica carinata]
MFLHLLLKVLTETATWILLFTCTGCNDERAVSIVRQRLSNSAIFVAFDDPITKLTNVHLRLDAAGEGQRSASKILLGGLQLSSLRYLISTSPASTNRSLSPIPNRLPVAKFANRVNSVHVLMGRYARSVKLSVDPNPVVKRNGEDNTNRFDIASFIDAPPVLLEPQPPQSHLVVAAVDSTTNDEKVQVVRRLAPPKHYNYGEYERPTNCSYAFAVFSSSH